MKDTERNNRVNVITKQCRKQATINRRQELEKRFTELPSLHQSNVCDLTSTANMWTFMRYDVKWFVERKTIIVQNVKDRDNITQVMTIMYRILKYEASGNTHQHA